MLAVRGVPAPVVHVVDMVPVRHGHVTASFAVDVVMILVHGVAGRFAFVVVIVVSSMKVIVVHVVDMVPMRDRDMTASFAVDVVMINVFAVSCVGHRFSPPFRPNSTRKSLAGRNFSPVIQACAVLFERLATLARACAVVRRFGGQTRMCAGKCRALGAKNTAGRIGTPGDIAAAVLFVMTSTFLTGMTLRVDGGEPLT